MRALLPDDRVARSAVELAGILLGVSAVLVVLGWGFNHHGLPSAFDLDGENVIPSVWSGGLLLGAAVATWLARRELGRAALCVAVLFAFMAVDEIAGVHEALERGLGIDWQILYAPLILAGGIGWLLVLRTLLRRQRLVSEIWLAGGAAWAVAQALEIWEWDGDVQRSSYYPKMYLEEALEMAGSACWLLVGYLLAQRVRTLRGPRGLTADEPSPTRSRATPPARELLEPGVRR